MKRWLAICLCAVCLAGALCRAVAEEMPYAPEPEEEFEVDENGIITRYKGENVDVVVPREAGGITVRGIGQHAFDDARTGLHAVRTIVLPETVEVLEEAAFSGMEKLRVFVSYGEIKEAGVNLFSACPHFETCVFLNGIAAIPDGCFDACPELVNFWSPADGCDEAPDTDTLLKDVWLIIPDDPPTMEMELFGG